MINIEWFINTACIFFRQDHLDLRVRRWVDGDTVVGIWIIQATESLFSRTFIIKSLPELKEDKMYQKTPLMFIKP